MAEGMTVIHGSNANDVDGKLTASGIIICIVAASAGLIFGYDVGVTGGVTTMEPFLEKFFPSVLKGKASSKRDLYCMYDSQTLTAFTSSLYIAGFVSSLVAGRITTATGRKGSLIIGGVIFLIGTALNAFAINLEMLISGRLLLGFGIGFTNQAAPVYLVETAPPKWRGTFGTFFPFFMTVGIIIASIVNYAAAQMGNYGWRIALGFAAMPATIMTIGALFIPDTPSSLIQRGKINEARQSLIKVRGIDSDTTEAELSDLISHNEAMKAANQSPYKTLLQRRYRPHLVLTVAIPIFQQLTGIIVISFYGPVLFRSVGFGSNGALIGFIILSAVNICSTLVSTYAVDRIGRRILFMQAGVQIFICEVGLAWLMASDIGTAGTSTFSQSSATAVLVLLCSIAAAFAWSWGPLKWLIPSEILPMEVRPAGQGICIAVTFVVSFILAQSFLTQLCHLKYHVFSFYAGWVLIMTTFVALFVPETKGISLESMDEVWQRHWYWHRYVQGTLLKTDMT